MKIEHTIIENELILHAPKLLIEPNALNNELLTEILNTYLLNNIEPTFEIYALLQIISKLDISTSNKFLIACIVSKTENKMLIEINNKAQKISKNPFIESERAIKPFNIQYDINVVKP